MNLISLARGSGFAAAAAGGWRFAQHPAFSPTVLVLVFIGAGALIAYLYAAQRKLASRGVVIALTIIRLLALLLLFILLMAPVVQWTHTKKTSGTLWLMLDHSLSMGMTDPQASSIERLHWAETLGLLPKSLLGQTARQADLAIARLSMVQQRLSRTHRNIEDRIGSESSGERKRNISRYTKMLLRWKHEMGKARRSLAAATNLGAATGGGIAAVQRARQLLGAGLAKAETQTRLRDVAHAIPWLAVDTNLAVARHLLKPIANGVDRQFLAAHQGDAAVTNAVAKVGNMSRARLAYAALVHEKGPHSILHRIRHDDTKIADFGRHVQAIDRLFTGSGRAQIKNALAPVGKATDFAAGLQYIAGHIADNEPATVLLVSDGRQNAGGDPTETARLLAARGVRVFTVCVGSRRAAPGAAVTAINAPNWIFKGDRFRASAIVKLNGLKGKTITVHVYRRKTLIHTTTFVANADKQTKKIVFHDKPETVGVFAYRVQVVPLRREIDTARNQRHFRVAVKKEKLQVLLADNQPDWEFQYLQALLSRDPRIHLQSVLLHPAKVEGVQPPPPTRANPKNPLFIAQRLPDTNKGWSQFDVIILGDVAPEDLPIAQQQYIANAVRNRGSALVCIAGPHNMPFRYAQSPLADLLPVDLASEWSPMTIARQNLHGFRPALAPEGTDSVLSQFGLTADANARLWSNMPLWYWHSEQTEAKPAAQVYWAISNPGGKGKNVGSLRLAQRRALLATMSVGLGKVLYLASNQTWRLRYVKGANVMNRFWGQVLQWATGTDLPAGGKFVRFGSNKSHYVQGHPISIQARVLGHDFTPMSGLRFRAVATLKTPGRGTGSRVVGSVTMTGETAAPGYYHGTMTGLPAGILHISLQGSPVSGLLNNDPTATEKTLRISIRKRGNLEVRDTSTDPAALRRIAYAGDGIMVNGPYAALLAGRMKTEKRTLVRRQQAGFFADPKSKYTLMTHAGFLIAFTILLCAEWILRKRAGLV